MLIIDRPDQSTDYTVFNLTHTPEVSIAHKRLIESLYELHYKQKYR